MEQRCVSRLLEWTEFGRNVGTCIDDVQYRYYTTTYEPPSLLLNAVRKYDHFYFATWKPQTSISYTVCRPLTGLSINLLRRPLQERKSLLPRAATVRFQTYESMSWNSFIRARIRCQ
jgi:hypothetical protein